MFALGMKSIVVATVAGLALAVAPGGLSAQAVEPPPRLDVGVSLSTPGGPGVTLDYRVWGPLELRGRWYGLAWGTKGRGVGVAFDLLHSSIVSVSAMGLWGEIRCSGDADTPVCSNGPGASQAWYAGGTAQFPITADHGWAFGLEVGRWFSTVSDPLNHYGQQPSRTMLAGVLKRFF